MGTAYRRAIHTVDSHTEGNPTRVIVGGVAVPPGATLLEKRAWLQTNDDGIRRMLNFEPRGSSMMCSVLLLPPDNAGSDFAAIIMEQDVYVPMCGHCIIGAATTVVATGMVRIAEPVTEVRFDTPAGLVTCAVAVEGGEVGAVTVDNVEGFVVHDRATIEAEGLGPISVDVAFGGDMYAFVDADALGLDLGPHNDAALIDTARRITAALNAQLACVHPERPDIDECYEVLFTSARTTTGDYKQTIVSPPGALDRSPCGTGTCARIALLYSRGEIGLGEPRRFEGVLGTCFVGEAVAAETRDGITFVKPRLTGRAFITGFHQFLLDRDDPFPEGFRIGPEARTLA